MKQISSVLGCQNNEVDKSKNLSCSGSILDRHALRRSFKSFVHESVQAGRVQILQIHRMTAFNPWRYCLYCYVCTNWMHTNISQTAVAAMTFVKSWESQQNACIGCSKKNFHQRRQNRPEMLQTWFLKVLKHFPTLCKVGAPKQLLARTQGSQVCLNKCLVKETVKERWNSVACLFCKDRAFPSLLRPLFLKPVLSWLSGSQASHNHLLCAHGWPHCCWMHGQIMDSLPIEP